MDNVILASEPKLLVESPVDVKLIKGIHFEPLRVDLPTTEEVRQYLAEHPRALLMPPTKQDGKLDSKEEGAEEPTAMWIAPTVTVPTSFLQYF